MMKLVMSEIRGSSDVQDFDLVLGTAYYTELILLFLKEL